MPLHRLLKNFLIRFALIELTLYYSNDLLEGFKFKN